MMEAFGKAMNLKIAALLERQRGATEQVSMVKNGSGKEFADAIKIS